MLEVFLVGGICVAFLVADCDLSAVSFERRGSSVWELVPLIYLSTNGWI